MTTSSVNSVPYIVSVIIPVYQDRERLELCLNAIGEQTIEGHLIEVIVINNDASEPITIDELKYPFRVLVLDEWTLGSYAARNAGANAASGGWFAFTDSDCIPARDWLEEIVELAQRGVTSPHGGPVRLFSASCKPSWADYYERALAFPQEYYIHEKGYSVTANLAVRRDVFFAVGMFRQDLRSGGDKEWCHRARDLGYSIQFAENMIVFHPSRGSRRELKRKAKRVIGSKFQKLRLSKL